MEEICVSIFSTPRARTKLCSIYLNRWRATFLHSLYIYFQFVRVGHRRAFAFCGSIPPTTIIGGIVCVLLLLGTCFALRIFGLNCLFRFVHIFFISIFCSYFSPLTLCYFCDIMILAPLGVTLNFYLKGKLFMKSRYREVHIHYTSTRMDIPILFDVIFTDGRRASFGVNTAPSDLKHFDPEKHFLAGVVGSCAIWYW